MIEHKRTYSMFPQQQINSSLKKENIPIYTSPSTIASRTVCFNTMHPTSFVHPRVLQSHWVNNNCHPTPFRPTSPKLNQVNPHPNYPKEAFIQLGGSREKRVSREKAASITSAQTLANELTINENLRKKVTMLQGRVKELHIEKQHLAVQLKKRLKGLQIQNQKLISIIKSSEMSKQTPIQNQHSEFNLEEMLANQINVNLELREQMNLFAQQLDYYKKTIENQQTQVTNLEEEKAGLNLQLLQLQDNSHDDIQVLKEQVQTLLRSLEKKDQTFSKIIQEKEKRILQLQEETFTLGVRLSEKQEEKQILSEQLSSLMQSQTVAKQQFEAMRRASEGRPTECKKCKELLHTVFRLNSQLNHK